MDADAISGLDIGPVTPRGGSSRRPIAGHIVQFYEDDAFLMDTASRFISDGLEAGSGAVLFATRSHLDGIEQRLRIRGLDVAASWRTGQYIPLDAAEALSRVMVQGQPDARRFAEVVGGRVAEAARDRRPPVRAFGEMVALLWVDGLREAAIRLERLWSDLARLHPFSLLCAYPMGGFARATDGEPFLNVCAEHTDVIPAESYTGMAQPDDRARLVTVLQQKAAALETEIAVRQNTERELASLLAREQAARAQAEVMARSKDDFLATLSHELRTPLTAMLGWIRMLRSGQLDAVKSAHALEVLERSTQAQARLIEDLLDVSRIIAGKLQLDIRQVEPASVIRTAMEAMGPAAAAKAMHLESSLDPSVGPVAGDPDRLQQVVWNLVSNAVKYTPRGGRVEVSLKRIDDRIVIAVKDTGVGIPPDFLPRVFDRFSQAGRGPARSHAGLGLGLAIVRHLAELHGGSVDADSPGEGQGATFTVSLPVPTLATDPPGSDIAAPKARHARAFVPRPLLQAVRVLIVEDDADARDLLATVLEQCGAEVRAVGSVDDAMAALDRLQPHVLVSDIGLPGQSGYELISLVRGLGASRGATPAVALTAYAGADDRARALAAGFEMHLSKPVEPDELVRIVARLAGLPDAGSAGAAAHPPAVS